MNAAWTFAEGNIRDDFVRCAVNDAQVAGSFIRDEDTIAGFPFGNRQRELGWQLRLEQ